MKVDICAWLSERFSKKDFIGDREVIFYPKFSLKDFYNPEHDYQKRLRPISEIKFPVVEIVLTNGKAYMDKFLFENLFNLTPPDSVDLGEISLPFLTEQYINFSSILFGNYPQFEPAIYDFLVITNFLNPRHPCIYGEYISGSFGIGKGAAFRILEKLGETFGVDLPFPDRLLLDFFENPPTRVLNPKNPIYKYPLFLDYARKNYHHSSFLLRGMYEKILEIEELDKIPNWPENGKVIEYNDTEYESTPPPEKILDDEDIELYLRRSQHNPNPTRLKMYGYIKPVINSGRITIIKMYCDKNRYWIASCASSPRYAVIEHLYIVSNKKPVKIDLDPIEICDIMVEDKMISLTSF